MIEIFMKKRKAKGQAYKIASSMLIIGLFLFTGCSSSKDSINEAEIRNIYNSVIINELENPRWGETEISYGYGYVNDDDIPELFLIRGTAHTDTVTIYSYDIQKQVAYYVGDFGGWGYCDYIPTQNSIISCYGNQGFFYIVESGIDTKGKPFIKDVILRNGGNKIESYYGFDLDGFTGAMPVNEYDINQFEMPGAEFLIDEKRADEIESRMREGSARISMDTICVESMKK